MFQSSFAFSNPPAEPHLSPTANQNVLYHIHNLPPNWQFFAHSVTASLHTPCIPTTSSVIFVSSHSQLQHNPLPLYPTPNIQSKNRCYRSSAGLILFVQPSLSSPRIHDCIQDERTTPTLQSATFPGIIHFFPLCSSSIHRTSTITATFIPSVLFHLLHSPFSSPSPSPLPPASFYPSLFPVSCLSLLHCVQLAVVRVSRLPLTYSFYIIVAIVSF